MSKDGWTMWDTGKYLQDLFRFSKLDEDGIFYQSILPVKNLDAQHLSKNIGEVQKNVRNRFVTLCYVPNCPNFLESRLNTIQSIVFNAAFGRSLETQIWKNTLFHPLIGESRVGEGPFFFPKGYLFFLGGYDMDMTWRSFDVHIHDPKRQNLLICAPTGLWISRGFDDAQNVMWFGGFRIGETIRKQFFMSILVNNGQ